jgi:integrase
MATITKRGDAYLVRWYGVHGDRRARSCPTRRSAEQLGRSVEEEKANGRDWEPPKPSATVEAVVAGYLKHVARTKRPATLATYSAQALSFVAFVGADEDASKVLSRRTLADYYDHLSASMTESSRQQYIQAAQRLWEWAHDSDEFGDDIGRPRLLEMRTLESTPTVAPTWAECDRCIAELPETAAGYRAAIIMRYTGLRVSQACGLVFGDIDTTAKTIRLRGELGKSKTERAGRIMPASPHLVAAVESWGGRPTDRIVTGARAEQHIPAAWARSGVRAEAYEGQPDHAFRKAFVSELRRAGADPDAVEYLVGHSSGIRGVYTDPSALPLVATVGLIAPIRITAGSGNVVALRKRT